MLENRQGTSHKRVAKRRWNAKKSVEFKTESLAAKDWLEDLDGYRTILYRLLQGKGVDCGWI